MPSTLTLTLSQRERGIVEVYPEGEGSCLYPLPEGGLFLTLSQRERELVDF